MDAPAQMPPALPTRSLQHTILQFAALGVALAILAWGWQVVDMRPLELFWNVGNQATFARDFFPPDTHHWQDFVGEMIVTVHIAIWGTVLAVIAAIPLSLLASANIAPWWIRHPVRRLLDGFRAIHEMVFALLFVVAVGLGPFAGALAIFVHTTGIFGKLFSEAVETIDPRPVEGIRATGASVLEEIRYGVIPQVFPLWMSYILYRFESNVRSATVLGIVGAGGIGMSLYETLRGFDYATACTILIMMTITVSLIDLLSAWIRRLTV